MNNAAYHGDLFRLKGLISAGADPSKPDYDGRTALVCELSHIVIVILYFEKNCNSEYRSSFSLKQMQHETHFTLSENIK